MSESRRSARGIDSDDLATWLLFFLEAHGATITVGPGQNIHVDLNTMPGLTADVVDRGRRSRNYCQSFARFSSPEPPVGEP